MLILVTYTPAGGNPNTVLVEAASTLAVLDLWLHLLQKSAGSIEIHPATHAEITTHSATPMNDQLLDEYVSGLDSVE